MRYSQRRYSQLHMVGSFARLIFSRRLPDGFKDEVDSQIVLETLSGRMLAPFRPRRGPFLASKIRSRGPQERLFGPFSPKIWNVKKYRTYDGFLTISASPGGVPDASYS